MDENSKPTQGTPEGSSPEPSDRSPPPAPGSRRAIGATIVLLGIAGLAGAGVLGGRALGGDGQGAGCGRPGTLQGEAPSGALTQAATSTACAGVTCPAGKYCVPMQTLLGGVEPFCKACKHTVCTRQTGDQVCVDLQTSRFDCGVCNTFPPSVNSYCLAGQYSLCRDTICTKSGSTSSSCSSLATDPSNCGACGVTCLGSQICHLGRCTAKCFDTWCGPQCIAVNVDIQNCGACGSRCPAGQTCVSGQCAPCTGTICGNFCLDLSTDHDNCGGCGKACDEDEICASGACQAPPCAQSLCAGACIDTAEDGRNCGGCGNECPTGTVCQSGSCKDQYVTMAMCDELKNAVRLADLAYADNANLPTKLAALPTGNFKLIKTYHGDQSKQGHAFLAMSTFGGKNVCYAAFRGSRESDIAGYILDDSFVGAMGEVANTVAFQKGLEPYSRLWPLATQNPGGNFGRGSSYVYWKYKNLAGPEPEGQNPYHITDPSYGLDEAAGIVDDVISLATAGKCPGGLRVVGHSVGGALASFLAAELYYLNPGRFSRTFMKVVTFGEVRGFSAEDADRYQTRITKYRVMNKHDYAPSMPSRGLGYKHWGTAKKIKEGGRTIVDEDQDYAHYVRMTQEPHRINAYVRRVGHCDCSDAGSGSGCASANNVCGTGLTVCNTVCRDLQNDETNCGSCGKVCPAGQSCLSGTCGCDDGETYCGNVCQDLKSDPTSCGTCGNLVAIGKACCNGAGVDYATDASNCGGCGIACKNGDTCCNGECVAAASDELHCGGCGVRCATSQICCSGVCKSVSSDANNCGQCGNVCASGSLCCNSTCADPNQAIQNCGACGTVCTLNADCKWSNCVCPTGQTCDQCPPGTKSIGSRKCVSCPLGQQLDGTSCTSCPAGTFRERPDQAFCIPCPAGSYQSQMGMTSCTLCPKGQYQSQSGQTSCLACPAGQYQYRTGQSACLSPLVYEVAADTYVMRNNSGPYGSQGGLVVTNYSNVSYDRKALLRFSLPAGSFADASLSLRLATYTVYAAGQETSTFNLYGIKNGAASACLEAFDEASLLYSNLPYLSDDADGVDNASPCLHSGTPLATLTATSGDVGRVVTFQSPALTQFLGANTNNVVTFVITRPNEGPYTAFNSKENGANTPATLSIIPAQ